MTGSMGHDLKNLEDRAQESLHGAEQDNNATYFASLPSKSVLNILDHANLVVARVPEHVSSRYTSLGDQAEFGLHGSTS